MRTLRRIYKFVWPSEADYYPSGKSLLLAVAIVALVVTVLAWLSQ